MYKKNGILLFSKLIDDIADNNKRITSDDDFAKAWSKAYDTLLLQLENYLLEGNRFKLDRYKEMKAQIELLQARAKLIAKGYLQLKEEDRMVSANQAGMAMCVIVKLNDALNIINPENYINVN